MKYVVKVYEIHFVEFEVDADSPESAKEKAEDLLIEGDDIETKYSHTMDSDDWTVEAI